MVIPVAYKELMLIRQANEDKRIFDIFNEN